MKKLFSKLAALGALLVGAFTIHSAANKAPVTANAVGEETWGLMGSTNGWTSDYLFTWNAANNRYELEITFSANDQFKIRKDRAWSTEIGWTNNGSYNNQSEYLSKGEGTNFKVKLSGDYLLTLAANISSLSTKASGFTIIPKSDLEPEPDAEIGTEKWGLVGSMTGWAAGRDIPFVWNEGKQVYELEYTFAVGNTFKIRRDGQTGSYNYAMGWYNDCKNIENHKKYLKEAASDANFEVTVAGKYVLTLASNISKLDPYNDGFTIAPASSPVDPTPDPEKGTEVWGLIGSMAGSNWSVDIPFTYNEEENRYEVTTYLTAGDQFKLRSDGKWDNEGGYVIGWHDDEAGAKANYLEEGTEPSGSKNGNFQVKEGCSGEYLLMLDDTRAAASKKNADFTIKLLEDDPTPDPEKGTEVWGLIGSMAESNWSADIPFTYNEEENRYEVTTYLTEGDQFKLRTDGKWDNEGGYVIGWHDDEAGAKANYLEEGTEPDGSKNGNFQVKEGCSGKYLLMLDDTKVAANKTNADFTVEFIEEPIKDPQVEADAFLADWYALRDEEDSICTADKNDIKAMIERYDALDADVKAIVDAATDKQGNTVKNSIEYLRGYVAAEANVSAEQTTTGLLLTVAKEHKSAIAIVIALIAATFVGFVVLNKKRRLVK